jgi:hypothetical protein
MTFKSIGKVDEERREERMRTHQLTWEIFRQCGKRPSYEAFIRYVANRLGVEEKDIVLDV